MSKITVDKPPKPTPADPLFSLPLAQAKAQVDAMNSVPQLRVAVKALLEEVRRLSNKVG